MSFLAFTLNGELLLDRSGQEYAFANLPSNILLVPAVSLNAEQTGILNLGRVRMNGFTDSQGSNLGVMPFAELAWTSAAHLFLQDAITGDPG